MYDSRPSICPLDFYLLLQHGTSIYIIWRPATSIPWQSVLNLQCLTLFQYDNEGLFYLLRTEQAHR